MRKKIIVFTDLDGTLLDYETYSFKEALPALNLLKKKQIPLVICTSKTRVEIEYYRKKLENKDPFIVENGGAIFIPKNYFSFPFKHDREDGYYYIIELGIHYKDLRKIVKLIEKQVKVRGFGDMNIKEIAEDANLSLEQAKLAKQREYVEALKIIDEKDKEKLLMLIKKYKLDYVEGDRYLHVSGGNDKGKAVKELLKLYKKEYKDIESYGFGDSDNDFKMLDVVDHPYLVQKVDSSYASDKYNKAQGIGPEGWNKTVLEIFSKI